MTVTPRYEKGVKKCAFNYRPIRLTLVLGITLETMSKEKKNIIR